ncbi:MAG: HD domain-containing protein [Oscillospiraceae bacterium]|nr:HD domain-containing protein [Oscillospiraceae bacterium]
MGKSRFYQKHRITDFIYFLLTTIFLLVVIFGFTKPKIPDRGHFIGMEDCWTDESGSAMSLNHLPVGETVFLTASLDKTDRNGKEFCLKSVDTVFDIYADEKLIYSYHPDLPKVLGLSYGMYVHTIPLPEQVSQLSLQAEPIFHTTHATIREVCLEESGNYITKLYRDNWLVFIRSCVTFLVGVLLLIIGVSNKLVSTSAGLDFISLGKMCTLLGFSGLNDTYILQIMTQQPALVRGITYFCLALMPAPTFKFFANASGAKKTRFLPVIQLLCLGNIAISVLLTFLGITDYYYTVNATHIIIVLDFLAMIYIVVRSVIQHTIRPQLVRWLIFGLAVSIMGGAADVLRYHLGWYNGYNTYSRMGILLFIVILVAYLFREQIRNLENKQKESILFINEITETFAKIIDMRDQYTSGHSARVAKYTAMLARELGCDEETVEKYYRIALLHDIGKIGIPTEVLNKPGKLTDEEYEIIKSHAQKGYDALKNISIMPELAIGAGAHHERPDGKGYPNGLKGDEIPYVAQIIAVADTFDAMYSNRPYRKRMNFEKAVSIIKEVSGTQLSPPVVEAFLRLVARGKFRAFDDNGGGSTENIDNIHETLTKKSKTE